MAGTILTLGSRHDIDSIVFIHDKLRPATEWMFGCGESHTSRDHDCAAFEGVRYIKDCPGWMAPFIIEV